MNDFETGNWEEEEGAFGGGRGYGGDVPYVVSAESGEAGPLARVEWIKLFGLLVGKEALATEKFNEIEAAYIKVRDRAFSMRRRPSVLVGFPSLYWDGQALWPLPGSASYTAALIRDANADYTFRNTSESVALEDVVDEFESVTFWINVSRYPAGPDETIDTLLSELPVRSREMIRKLRAVKCGNIWSFAKEISSNGKANNYFEEAPLRPDLVLADLLEIFHPEWSDKGPDDLKFYYKLDGPAPDSGVDSCPQEASGDCRF